MSDPITIESIIQATNEMVESNKKHAQQEIQQVRDARSAAISDLEVLAKRFNAAVAAVHNALPLADQTLPGERFPSIELGASVTVKDGATPHLTIVSVWGSLVCRIYPNSDGSYRYLDDGKESTWGRANLPLVFGTIIANHHPETRQARQAQRLAKEANKLPV